MKALFARWTGHCFLSTKIKKLAVELFDTHCHIQSAGLADGERLTREVWSKDPKLTGDWLMSSAQANGVSRLICVGCDLADSRLAINFAAQHNGAWASIGIHPHEAKDFANKPTLLADFAALASKAKVVAVGECGLDYYYEHSPKIEQEKILRFQIELALKNDLPIIFHVRDAFDDFWPIFADYRALRGVLHSFTDNQSNLIRALEAGLYIGVNGIATFVKQPEQKAMYAAIPLENLLIETDAPFLTPTPYRGSINEPKQALTVAAYLCEIYDIDLNTLATATTANAKTLFGLK